MRTAIVATGTTAYCHGSCETDKLPIGTQFSIQRKHIVQNKYLIVQVHGPGILAAQDNRADIYIKQK
jgi:hypothetical protein